MPVIRTPAKSVDKPALTFEKSGGNSGAAFQSAVIGAIQDNPTAIPQAAASLQITEIAELAQQQDDTLFDRLINNNVNLRYSATAGATKPTIAGNLQVSTLFPFDQKDFNSGSMERSKDYLYFTCNKCGVYRVSFGFYFAGIGAVVATNPYITLIKTTPSVVGNPYGDVFWRGTGVLDKFWASGSDLIELDVGEQISLGINNGDVGGGGISTGTYGAHAWIAINYTGNQH